MILLYMYITIFLRDTIEDYVYIMLKDDSEYLLPTNETNKLCFVLGISVANIA